MLTSPLTCADLLLLTSYLLLLTSALASHFGRGVAAKGGDGEGNSVRNTGIADLYKIRKAAVSHGSDEKARTTVDGSITVRVIL